MAKRSTKTTDRAGSSDKVLQDHELAELTKHVHAKADDARRRGTARAIVDEVLFVLLTDAGLKPKEICDLNVGDIPDHRKSTTLRIRHHPAGRNRHVRVSRQAIKRLRTFVQINRQGARSDDPLLLSEQGTRMGYISIYNKIRRLGQEVGLPRLHPNTLRKTCMFRLFQKEQDIRLVQQQAGHASHKTTIQYLKASAASFSDPCDACGHPIAPNTGTRIDSGHLLCSQCLKALRRKVSR